MDWDRTGGKLQTSIRDRLMALDSNVDEELRNTLLRAMKPEGRTVESLLPHAQHLVPVVQGLLSDML
jgi:5S rRNA maturation endonuclease (ribonuclease M5)